MAVHSEHFTVVVKESSEGDAIMSSLREPQRTVLWHKKLYLPIIVSGSYWAQETPCVG